MIERVEANYTGGGIFIYTGELDTGNFFFTATDWEADVLILDEDPEEFFDECDMPEWQEKHTIREITGTEAMRFWLEMLDALEFFGGCETEVIRRERRYIKRELKNT